MKCDILFLSPEFGFGGHGNHSLKVVKFLLDEGFRVCTHAVVNEKSVSFSHPNFQVLQIVRPFLGFDVFNPFFDLMSSLHLRGKEKPRLIIRVLPPFYLDIPWISNSKIPELAISHGVVYSDAMKNFKRTGKMGIKREYSLSSIGKVVRESEKIMLNRAKRILAVSEYTKRNLIDVFNISEEKIQVVHNFVDTNLFKRKKEVTSEIGNRIKDFKNDGLLAVFVFGAYPTSSKNIDLLFDIITNLRNINLKFVVVGLDESNEYFQNYVRVLKRHKTLFLGYVDNHLLPEVYSLADFLLITAIEENLPTVLLEAMACGTIPISTNVGGIPEVVKDNKNGFLVHPNRKEFLNIIGELVDYDHRTLSAISKNAEKDVKEKFDVKIAKKKYVDIVNQIISV